MAPTRAASPVRRRSDVLAVAGVAAAVALVHLALSGRYGFHREELYHLAAGRHPALGYVDQPPVVPLLGRAVTLVAGEHLWPLRAVAGLAHAAVVLLTAALAGELGGGPRARVLAAVAAATVPLYVGAGSLFRPVVFDQLWWAVAVLLVARLLNGADPRGWLAVGAVVGVGLDTRWTMVLLVIGLGAGALAVPEARRHLATPWAGAGALVAAAVWVPNLAWQALNGWPALELAGDDGAGIRDVTGRPGVVLQQIGYLGPAAAVLVGAGMVWLWRSGRWRMLAVAAATVAALVLVVGGEADHLGPLYVLGVAAGAVAAEPWIAADPVRGPVAVGALVASGLLPLALVAPVVPVDVYAGSLEELDDELGEQVGWPEMVDLVAAVVAGLPAEERVGVRVVTASSGEAAAIDLYGPARGLLRGTALSGHDSYADWWPEGEPPATFLTVGYPRRAVEAYCDRVLGPVAVVAPVDGVDNEGAGAPILVCRGLTVSPERLLDMLRHDR